MGAREVRREVRPDTGKAGSVRGLEALAPRALPRVRQAQIARADVAAVGSGTGRLAICTANDVTGVGRVPRADGCVRAAFGCLVGRAAPAEEQSDHEATHLSVQVTRPLEAPRALRARTRRGGKLPASVARLLHCFRRSLSTFEAVVVPCLLPSFLGRACEASASESQRDRHEQEIFESHRPILSAAVRCIPGVAGLGISHRARRTGEQGAADVPFRIPALSGGCLSVARCAVVTAAERAATRVTRRHPHRHAQGTLSCGSRGRILERSAAAGVVGAAGAELGACRSSAAPNRGERENDEKQAHRLTVAAIAAHP
jgi:hypothetical protein